MKLIFKINLGAIGLLGASAVLVGAFFVASFRDLSAETYHWFDASAQNLALSIGNQARESIAYFDYKTIESALERRLADDRNLLFASVSFGDGLKERRAAGSAQAGPSRSYDATIAEGASTVAVVTIHYATAGVKGKLDALVERLAVGAALAFLVLFGALSFIVQRLVSRPLKLLVHHAEVTAAGDLTSVVPIATKDEFGTLAAAMNQMTANLRAMVEKVRLAFSELETVSRDIADVSHHIAEGSSGVTGAVNTVSASIEQMNGSIKSVVQSVENLFSLAGESSSSILQMSASVEQVAGNAEGLSAAVERSSSSMTEMNVSVRNVAENIAKLAELVTSASSSIMEIDSVVREIERNAGEGHELSREVAATMSDEGMASLRRAAEGMDAIRTSVAQAATVIRGLESRSHEIGSILRVINEVNDQTNLLALNAAILAAQAGEHGRGFAVVAEEIRELSARTSSSTKEITKLIASIRKESTAAVEAMDEGTRKVEEGVRTVDELGQTLRRAAENSEKASAASRGIALSTSEQYKGIQQITRSSQKIKDMSQEIASATREQATGGSQIVRAAEEMRDLAQQVRRAMAEQAKGLRQTSQASEQSAQLSQRVLNATREEAQGSDLVVRTIGSIQEISNANAEAVKRLDQMVSILSKQADLLKSELDRFKIV